MYSKEPSNPSPSNTEPPFPRPAVICLRIRGSRNLGAISRLMMNFGLTELVLADPRRPPGREARRTACHAWPVLERARIVKSLEDVLGEYTLLVGTSGKAHHPALITTVSPAAAAGPLRALPADTRPALLLGPEDHGLSNRELKLCRWIIQIPTHPDYPSMNISHAAAVVLYEWLGRTDGPAGEPAARPVTPLAEMEDFYRQLSRLLGGIGFLNRQNPAHIMYTLRRILARTGLDPRERKILLGIFRQAGWAWQQASREPVPPGSIPEK